MILCLELEVENIKVSWEKLAEAIHSTSNTLPKRLPKNADNAALSEIDPDVLNLKNIMKVVASKSEFKHATKIFSDRIETSILTECEILEKELKSAPKSAYRTIRNIVGDNRSEFAIFGRTAKESLEAVRNHFSKVGHETVAEKVLYLFY